MSMLFVPCAGRKYLCRRRASGCLAILALLPFLAACQHPLPFQSLDSGPMCARDVVVRYVTLQIANQAPYDELMPGSIGEQPTADPAVVRCVATVVNRNYDYVRYWSQSWQGYQEYTVRKMTNAYRVEMGQRIGSAVR